MVSNHYNLDLDRIHPSIKEKLSSPQFPLSEMILDKRIELGYDYEKMAKISDTTKQNFIRMENSDLEIKVEDYIDALFNIEIHVNQFTQSNEMLKKKLNNNKIKVNIKFNNEEKIKLSGGEKWQLLAV